MSLQTKLDEIREGFMSQVPEEVKVIVGRNSQALFDSGLVEKVLKKGDSLPPFALKDSRGQERHVGELNASGGPLVISFFRGFW